MYYFLFVCVAFFIPSFIIRDIYMKTAFFCSRSTFPNCSCASSAGDLHLPSDGVALSPGGTAPAPARGHVLGMLHLQVRQPPRDVTAPGSSLAVFKGSCEVVGMLRALILSRVQELFVPFQEKEAGVNPRQGGILAGCPRATASGCGALGSRRSSFERTS